MNEIILIGSGGHARACIDVIECENRFQIAGLVEKYGTVSENNLDYPIIGMDDDLEKLRQKYNYAIVSVGQIKSPGARIKLYNLLKSIGYKLPIVTSPLAYVSKQAKIGEGTIVMHNAMVNAGARIGTNCIINSKALVEHDTIVADHCHIATGAIVNGGVSVGEGTFIGSGAVIRHVVSIGKGCVIGAGCVVKQNVIDQQVVTY